MSGELRIFNFHANQVRTLTDKSGELWFVAKDVCDVLGLSNPSEALRTLDDDERTQVDPQNFLGSENRSNTPVNLISEAGLYRLVMRSRKQVAKEFQRWLSHEVLPQIRRTGGYVPAGETDEETMARAMLIARRTIEDQRQRISQTESKVAELEPKARFADAVAASDGTCLVGELAKMLRQSGTEIGQNRLFRILRDEGFLGKVREQRERAHAEGDGARPVRDQGNRDPARRRPHEREPHPQGHRQGPDLLPQPLHAEKGDVT